MHSRFLLTVCGLNLLGACVSPVGKTEDSPVDSEDSNPPEEVAFTIQSPDFISDEAAGIEHDYDCHQALPIEFSCGNPNPEIQWEGIPVGTTHFLLLFDDPTAGNFPHWAIFNIPAQEMGLAQAISGESIEHNLPEGAIELNNGFGFEGYLGSCPSGINQYRWRLWALSEELTAPTGSATQQFYKLASQAEKVSLGYAEMCHVFDGTQLSAN